MHNTFSENDKPFAVVIGLDCMTGLQTARILAKRGVPVIAVAKDANHFACRTKVCKQILIADTASSEFLTALENLGPKLAQKAVLFPCIDMSVLQISRNRDRLSRWFHVVLPTPEVVEMLMDKVQFLKFAQREGLSIPGTFFLNNRDDAENAAAKLSYPCILKPPFKSTEWQQNTKTKAYKIQSSEELLQIYDRSCRWADILMAQEWVEGSDASLYSCNCYFDSTSKPLVTFVARKLRQWPPETGTSCLGEEIRNDTVLEETIRLFRKVNYYGLGYVEMKRDEHTGKHYIIEPNIGRPTGRSAIAEAGGVELVYSKYCDVTGQPLPENRMQKYRGVKWVYLRRDLQSAFYYWRRGDLTLREWWRSLRGKKGYAVFSWDDPAPFVWDFINKYGEIRARKKSTTMPKPETVKQESITETAPAESEAI